MNIINRIVLIQVFAAMTLLIGRYLIVFQSPAGYATMASFTVIGSQALLFLGWNLFLATLGYALLYHLTSFNSDSSFKTHRL